MPNSNLFWHRFGVVAKDVRCLQLSTIDVGLGRIGLDLAQSANDLQYCVCVMLRMQEMTEK